MTPFTISKQCTTKYPVLIFLFLLYKFDGNLFSQNRIVTLAPTIQGILLDDSDYPVYFTGLKLANEGMLAKLISLESSFSLNYGSRHDQTAEIPIQKFFYLSLGLEAHRHFDRFFDGLYVGGGITGSLISIRRKDVPFRLMDEYPPEQYLMLVHTSLTFGKSTRFSDKLLIHPYIELNNYLTANSTPFLWGIRVGMAFTLTQVYWE